MRRKALIVTERRELYQEIIESLQNSCLKIDHSATYAQAVNRCSRFHYILMILDIHFSEMNGMAVVRRLRQLERAPILVLSARYSRQEEIEALMDRCHALGTKVVGVTLGSRGSIFSEEGKRYHQGIVPVEAIDTMGAGDSFIAGFLTRRILGDGMEDALRFAATAAANTCKFHGGFGYPHPLD